MRVGIPGWGAVVVCLSIPLLAPDAIAATIAVPAVSKGMTCNSPAKIGF